MFRERPSRASAFFAALVAFCLAHPAARAASAPRVGVLPSSSEGAVPERLLRDLEAALAEDVAALGGFDVVEATALARQIESARAIGLACGDRDAACLAKVGALAGADVLLGARAGPAPGGARVEVVAIDVRSSKEASRVVEVPSASRARGPLREAVAHLLRPPRDGVLEITVADDGARVLVDGAPLPGTASPFVARAQPGPRLVRVEKPGHRPLEREVVVRAGETTAVRLDLQPDVAPAPAEVAAPAPTIVEGAARPLDPVLVSGVAVLGAGTAVLAGASGWAAVEHAILHDYALPTDARRDAQARGRVSVAAIVGGAAAAAIGGAVAGTALVLSPE